MLQRVIPVQHPDIAFDETPDTQAPRKLRMLARAFANRFQRVLRVLLQFAAAGGSLS
jgi:hypothetical protein